MRTLARFALFAAVLLAASARTAAAQGGVNLSWNDCGTFGTLQRNFACNVNTGQDILVGSGVSGMDLPELNGMYAVIDVAGSAPLSNWWRVGSGDCRQGALAPDFSFVSGPFNCLDPWSGTAAGGATYDYGTLGPHQVRIRLTCAAPVPAAINATDEYYFFKVAISHAKSVGTGSCGGCTSEACINLRLIQLSQPAGDYYSLIYPISRSFVRWQSGGWFSCPAVDEPQVPTRAQTWGAVKSLYR